MAKLARVLFLCGLGTVAGCYAVGTPPHDPVSFGLPQATSTLEAHRASGTSAASTSGDGATATCTDSSPPSTEAAPDSRDSLFAPPARFAGLGSLTIAIPSPDAPVFSVQRLDSPSDYEEFGGAEPRRRRRKRTEFSANFNFSGYPWAEFDLGDIREQWDESWKYELNISAHFPLSGHVEPLVGAYFYFEDRDWSEGNSSVRNKVFGLGGEFAALLYLFKDADQRAFNLALMPFGRIGFGFNRGNFDNILTNVDGQPTQALASGDLDSVRFELAGGLDLRMIVARRVTVGLGAGVAYWNAFDVSGSYSGGVGVIVIRDFDFDGLDTFVRLTVGVLF